MENIGIVANRNTVPNDSGSPYYPSGLRLGTQALTVRGMKEKQMSEIASIIKDVVFHLGKRVILENEEDRKIALKKFKEELKSDDYYLKLKEKVSKLAKRFSIPE